MATRIRRHRTLFTVVALGCPGRLAGRGNSRRGRRRRRRRAAAGCCWRPSAPTRRASTPTRSRPSPPSSRWRRSTARSADRSLPVPERHRRRGQRVEDRARRAHVHVQDPPGDPVPRRLAADGRRRQGDLRQDRLPAGRGPQHPEAPLLGDRERRGPGPGHRGVQAQVPVGLAPDEPGLAVERHLSRRSTSTRTRTTSRPTSWAPGPSSSRATRAGSTFEGERNPDYFVKDRPYLNGYKFFISTETSVRAAAIRSGRAYIEFRDLPNSEVEAIKKQLGDKVVVQQTPFVDPVRHRDQQHREAVHRRARPQGPHAGHRSLHGGQGAAPAHGPPGRRGLTRPGTEWAMSPAELEKFPGFWRDAEKNRAEAKRLLAEAGYPNGFKVVLKNRNVKLPYQDFAVYVIQEWRKIGIEAEHRPLETAAWYADGRDTGELRADGLPDRRVHRRSRSVAGALRHRDPRRTGAASPTPRSTTCTRGRPGRSTRPSAGGWSSSSRRSCWRTRTTCRGSGGRGTSCTGPR